MKCLMKYQWVKLPRNQLPPGKGVLGAWARLASRAAFRDGQAVYCGYINQVTIGSWAGGIVGLKSILGIKNRKKALETMDKLAQLGYIEYTLDPQTKKLTYQIKDWVINCSGAPCMGREAVYATDGYGFLCLPRSITQRLAEAHDQFGESDAWLDLWCHSVWQEPGNAFSHIAPAVQYGRYGAVLTLEALGRRWGWEKTKVWRFFRKYADAFPLFKLPGSFGCLIFNAVYPTGQAITLPSNADIARILEQIRICGEHTHFPGATDHERLCKLVAWYSRRIAPLDVGAVPENRVSFSHHNNIHAYFSLCGHCKNSIKDCQGKYPFTASKAETILWASTGPPFDTGGIEYGTFGGIPLW